MLRSVLLRSNPSQLIFKILPRESIMSFHFASTEYTECFKNVPKPDIPKIRDSAIKYLDSFDEKEWFNDPVRFFYFFFRTPFTQGFGEKMRSPVAFLTRRLLPS